MTTPPPGQEPPVGESLWVDADWWRAMSEPDSTRGDDDAAAALSDPLTDPLPRPGDDGAPADPLRRDADAAPPAAPAREAEPEPEPEPEPALEPASDQARAKDLHVPRVLPEEQPVTVPPALTPPRKQAPRVQPASIAPQRRDRRRVGPAVKSHLGDVALLLLALGVLALVYVALTR